MAVRKSNRARPRRARSAGSSFALSSRRHGRAVGAVVFARLPLHRSEGLQHLSALLRRLQTIYGIAVTAEASTDQMNKAKSSGFDGFLGKPLDPDKFPDQIRRILNGESVWEYS